MMLDLDPATMRRIQNEIDLGHAASPSEVVSRALDMVDAEQEWLLQHKEAINRKFEKSMTQAAQGKVHSAKDAASLLDQHIADRVRKAS